jgi:hypothetical protein
MGKRQDELRALFNTLSREEKQAHVQKIARYRAMGQLNRCDICGRPTAGFVPSGMTLANAGICSC